MKHYRYLETLSTLTLKEDISKYKDIENKEDYTEITEEEYNAILEQLKPHRDEEQEELE